MTGYARDGFEWDGVSPYFTVSTEGRDHLIPARMEYPDEDGGWAATMPVGESPVFLILIVPHENEGRSPFICIDADDLITDGKARVTELVNGVIVMRGLRGDTTEERVLDSIFGMWHPDVTAETFEVYFRLVMNAPIDFQ